LPQAPQGVRVLSSSDIAFQETDHVPYDLMYLLDTDTFIYFPQSNVTVIGCTALALNYTVVTNNTKHYDKIRGLKVVNWA